MCKDPVSVTAVVLPFECEAIIMVVTASTRVRKADFVTVRGQVPQTTYRVSKSETRISHCAAVYP
jgi:hypothetical protein